MFVVRNFAIQTNNFKPNKASNQCLALYITGKLFLDNL